jgi:shikimate dehydrogenase
MKKFFSISQFPGNTGKYYYESFFEKNNIEASYTPVGTNNIKATFDKILIEQPSGISISMPYKQTVIKLVDNLDESVTKYNSCNTIKFSNNKSLGFNADFFGVIEVCKYIEIKNKISILGNGCMAKMFKDYLYEFDTSLYANSLNNWESRYNETDVVINCTALGTSEKTSPLDLFPKNTKLVIDLAVNDNNLKALCYKFNIKYISGIIFYKAQFLQQFYLYTDIKADPDYFDYLTKIR